MVFVRKQIDPSKINNIKDLMTTVPYRTISNDTGFYNLVDLDNNTNGLEIYFVTSLYGDANEKSSDGGIALACYNKDGDRNGNSHMATTMAHEIGHASGLKDIYDIKELKNDVVLRVPEKQIPNVLLLPGDCTAGANYYDTEYPDYRYNNILRKLLMYGYGEAGGVHLNKYDIPRNKVSGIGWNNDDSTYTIKQCNVGLIDMNRSPTHN